MGRIAYESVLLLTNPRELERVSYGDLSLNDQMMWDQIGAEMQRRMAENAAPKAALTAQQQDAVALAIFDNDYSGMKRLKASGQWPYTKQVNA